MSAPKRIQNSGSPLTLDQQNELIDLFYGDKVKIIGRDKLYKKVVEADIKPLPSRRSVMDWLKAQPIWKAQNESKITKVIKPLIKDKQAYYKIKWGWGSTSIEPREELMKKWSNLITDYEKQHKVVWYQTPSTGYKRVQYVK